MSRRSRILAFGSAAVLVVAGAACAIFVGGLTGEVLAISLLLAGLGAIVLLVFFEIGLSEERAVAREEERRRRRATPPPHAQGGGPRRRRPRRRG